MVINKDLSLTLRLMITYFNISSTYQKQHEPSYLRNHFLLLRNAVNNENCRFQNQLVPHLESPL